MRRSSSSGFEPKKGSVINIALMCHVANKRGTYQDILPFSYVEINGLKVPTPQHAYTVLWEAISGQKISNSKTALRGLEEHFSEKGRMSGVGGPRGHTL